MCLPHSSDFTLDITLVHGAKLFLWQPILMKPTHPRKLVCFISSANVKHSLADGKTTANLRITKIRILDPLPPNKMTNILKTFTHVFTCSLPCTDL